VPARGHRLVAVRRLVEGVPGGRQAAPEQASLQVHLDHGRLQLDPHII